MADERDLRIKVKAEGYDEATDAERKLAEAEEKTTEALKEKAAAAAGAGGAEPVREAAEAAKEDAAATAEQAASKEDLKNVLNQIHPAFGQVVDMMEGARNLANQLATAKLSLAGGLDKVTASLKANAAAYALLGMGGVVLGALYLIQRAWQGIKDDIDAAKRAGEEFAESQTKIAGEREAARERIVDDLVKAGRADAATVEEATRLEDRLRRAGFGEVSAQAAAAMAGQGADFGQVLAAAAGAQVGKVDLGAPDVPGQTQRAMADADSRRQIEQAVSVRGAEEDRLRERARRQLESYDVERDIYGTHVVDMGEADAIRRLIEQRTGKTGEEAQKLITRMQEMMAEAEAGGVGVEDLEWDESFFTGALDPAQAEALGLLKQFGRQRARPSQAEIGTTVIHQHYGERNYNTSAGLRGGKNGANFRDRVGAG